MTTTTKTKVGQKMRDGTIFAGISPDTKLPLYTTPDDAFYLMNWHQGMNYAKDLRAHGRSDWRLPTPAELDLLFTNRVAIGDFDNSDLPDCSWYWSSAEYRYYEAHDQRFTDGLRSVHSKTLLSAVRCVRTTERRRVSR